MPGSMMPVLVTQFSHFRSKCGQQKGGRSRLLHRHCKATQYLLVEAPSLMSFFTDVTPLVFLAIETALSASSFVFALPLKVTTPLSVST